MASPYLGTAGQVSGKSHGTCHFWMKKVATPVASPIFKLSNTLPTPGSVRINTVPRDSISPYTPLGEYQEHILARKTLTTFQQ